MKKKLLLTELKVTSFITRTEGVDLKGGTNTPQLSQDINCQQLSNDLQCGPQYTTYTQFTLCEPVCQHTNPVRCRTDITCNIG